MKPKRIAVLNGHPGVTSLSRHFAETYTKAATRAGHEVRLTHLHDLAFDMDYGTGGYTTTKPLEPELETFLADLEWADHVVMAAPLWWGSVPAKLKGLFDRMLIPGRAFDTRSTTALGLPKPLLAGKTGRIIITADTPRWLLRVVYGNAMLRQLAGQVFGFVGIRPTRFTYFSDASHPKQGNVERWAARVEKIGAQAA